VRDEGREQRCEPFAEPGITSIRRETMKHGVICFVVCALSLFAGRVYGHCIFAEAVGGSGSDVIYDMVETYDGGVVVTGYTTSYGAKGRDLLLGKFDSDGNRLWTKRIGGGNDEEGWGIYETSNRSLVVTGYTTSYGGAGDNLLISKFEANGDHLWTRVLTHTAGDLEFRGYDVIEDSGHDYVITGYMHRHDLNRRSLLMSKFDASGNEIMTRTFYGTVTPLYDHYGRSVVQASDGDYVVVGWLDTPTYGEVILFARIASGFNDQEGLWIGEEGCESARAYSLSNTSDGGFAITGLTCDRVFFSLRNDEAVPIKQWKMSAGSSEGRSVTKTFDDGFAIPGRYSDDLLLCKFNVEGDPDWARGYRGSGGDEMGYSVVELSDPGQNLMVGGRTNTWGAGGNDLLLCGFDSEGSSCLQKMLVFAFVEWNPSEYVHYLSRWTPLDYDVWPWTPTITRFDPVVTVVCTGTRTYVVEPDGSGHFPTIQEAIDAVCNGDTIELADGTFKGTGNRHIFYRGKAITVRSQHGAEACTVDCEARVLSGPPPQPCRGFNFTSGEGADAVLEGVTITNGSGSNYCGGAIYCISASPTIRNCVICGNKATCGGGIYCDSSSSPELIGCVITGNMAEENGGGICCSGSGIRIIGCTISGNKADWGGGIYGACSPEYTIIWGNCTDKWSENYVEDSLEIEKGDEWYGDGGYYYVCCNDIDTTGLAGFGCDTLYCDYDSPNISEDPRFLSPVHCDNAPTAEGDYHLHCISPCADHPDCGLIGALGVERSISFDAR
jgi:parallel beta-helix repeat protein